MTDWSVLLSAVTWHLSYLIGDHDQRVLVLGEKIKEAPQSESIPLWHNAAAAFVRPVVFLCGQSPTQFIYIFLNKGAFDNLRDIRQELEQQVAHELPWKGAHELPCPGCICSGKACNPGWTPDRHRHPWNGPPTPPGREGCTRPCTGCGTAPGQGHVSHDLASHSVVHTCGGV